MPDKYDRCVDEVMAEGHDESTAHAICEASIDDGKSFEDTKLARLLKSNNAEDWHDTVGRLVRSEVESTVIADVVKRALSGGSRQQAQKAMAKSAKIEKVGFEAEMRSQFTVFKAGDDDFVVWGPASVEIVDKEGDKIQAKALQKALPQLLKRARLSLEHSDQLVGRILERFNTEEEIEVEVDGTTFRRKKFPTDVLEVDKMEPALYVAGEIFNDTRQAQETRKRIQDGELNSYSISGEALVTQKRVTSEGDTYDDIVDIDLSAVTICEEGMNEKAKFAQISESGEKKTATAAKSDDPVSPGGQGESPTVSAVTSLAKSAIDETMTEQNKSGDNSQGGFNPEALTKEFKSVLDEKLPDGELATKDDTLSRSDVESIAREIYREDDAGEGGFQDEGTSDTADDPTGRPGEGADVEGDGTDQRVPPRQEPHSGETGEESERPSIESKDDEDDAGEGGFQDEGTSDTDNDPTGRPGDEADVEGDGTDQRVPPRQESHSGDTGEESERPEIESKEDAVKQVAESILELVEDGPRGGSYDEDDDGNREYGDKAEDHEEDFGDEDDYEVPEDEYVDDEDEEEEVVVEAEEEPEDRVHDPEAEEEYEDQVPDEKDGYGAEDLEEKLPADVWEVVREYLDDGEGMAGDEMGDEMDDEGEEVMAAQKSDNIESAVEKILDGKGLEKAGGASAPSGTATKSYDGEPESNHGNNPALATFYGE